MASIIKRPNGKWRARYRDADGREHARHFDRKVDGQRWLDEQTAAIVTGVYVDPKAGRTLVRSYAKDWAASAVGSDSTRRIIDNALRVHLLPRIGDRQLGTLRRSDVQAVVKTLSLELAPASVRGVYGVLRRMLTSAVDDRLLPASPCSRIALPAVPDHEVVPPTIDQVCAIAQAMPPRYRAAVTMLAGSGLRIGELLGLRTTDVDFLRRAVRVQRQRMQHGAIGPLKTSRSARTVPLGSIVVGELAAHLAAFPSDEWLFTDESGAALRYRVWRRLWDAAAPDSMTTHDLRHFFASALIAGGASVKAVQTTLGHGSAAITLQVYSHLWPGDEDRSRSIMDAALAELGEPADRRRTR